MRCRQRNHGRRLFRKIDHDMRKHMIQESPPDWLQTYSLQEWQELDIEAIDENMRVGKCMLIRDTKLNVGWNYDMDSAVRIKSGASLLDVQGMFAVTFRRCNGAEQNIEYSSPHLPGGIEHVMEPLSKIINGSDDRVLNCLSAPQQAPLVQIPRQK